MAITYRIDQIVKETLGTKAGQHSVYVLVIDDADPQTILARTCVQGDTKEEIKAALAVKLQAVKTHLTADAATHQAAADALVEIIDEEGTAQ